MNNFSLKHIAKVFETPANWATRRALSLSDSFNEVAHHVFTNGIQADVKGVQAEIIKMKVAVYSGADADPPGKEGLAHFAEHMAFYGTRQIQRLCKEFERRGGLANAVTESGRTNYEFRIANTPENVELLYQLSSGILFDHDVEEDQLQIEKEVLTTEMQEKQDYMQGDFEQTLRSQAFGIENVVNGIGGRPETLQSITREDVQQFRSRQYVASNMKVELSGVPAASAYRGLNKYMGSQPAVAPPELNNQTAQYCGGYRHIDAPQARQSYVGVAFPLQTDTDYELENVMREYLTAALQSRLRGFDGRCVYNCSASTQCYRGARIMIIATNARTEKADAILPAISAIVTDIAQGRIDPDSFATALAQNKRGRAEYEESLAHDPRDLMSPIERWFCYRRDRKRMDAIQPSDLVALAKDTMLAKPPTLVTKGDIGNVQTYDRFKAMFPLNAAPT